jgi:hypothetical protein
LTTASGAIKVVAHLPENWGAVMADVHPDDLMSVPDMRQWANQELKDTAKAAELRARQVNALVDDYASGKLTSEEATLRYRQYQERWGEALPGATMNEGLSDEAILAKMDGVRRDLQETRRKSSRSR